MYEKRLSLMASFEHGLQASYFEKEENLAALDHASDIPEQFYLAMDIITNYIGADDDKRRALKGELKSLMAKEPSLNRYYQEINNVKQDLATFALRLHATDLAIYLINGEDKEDVVARELYLQTQARTEGHRDDDDEPSVTWGKTDKQKAELLAMFGTNDVSFGMVNRQTNQADMATILMSECKAKQHQKMSIETNRGTLTTTPFMYFLQKNYNSDNRIYIPTDLRHSFYYDADLRFKNFEDNDLGMAVLKTHFPDLSAQIYQKTLFEQPKPEQKKEDDLFSFADSQNTAATEPKTVSHQGKAYTPDLPGLFLERE